VTTAFAVHGHFYQPPRENPWTEEIDPEPSAAPWANWNERITDECYRPNGWAPILEDSGKVLALVDNYERLSFDVGPTLASWLADNAPDVLDRMVAGDRVGGGAMASAYNHIILPLAPERDVRTQLRWGRADFRARFGREPDGVWFPETAVDEAVLAIAAEEGVRFTVLAPTQAARVRPLGSDEPWQELGGAPVDARRTYRWHHPSREDLAVDIVFYDGALSADLAFGEAWKSAAALVERASAAAPQGGLVCAATDGETFGHHHRYAERALAYALPVEAPRAGVEVVTVAGALRTSPPEMEVEVGPSSWSCAHGLERWRSDCGCNTGGQPGATQAWRAPLRAALDLVRTAVDGAFERRGAAVLTADPWAARDAYGEVVVGTTSVEAFAATHVVGGGADDAALVEALTLLEAERHALLMYTSCGWFFWDLAGLETVQVLRYAARALDLLEEVGEPAPRDAVLEVLAGATSNVAAEGTGADVWRRRVEPARVDAARVAAALALAELLDLPRPGCGIATGSGPSGAPGGPVAGFEVATFERTVACRGSESVCFGTVTLVHQRTRRRSTQAWAAIELGGLGVTGATHEADPPRDAEAQRGLQSALAAGAPATALLRRIVDGFGPGTFGVEAALPGPAPAAPASGRARLTPSLQEVLVEAVDRALAGGGDEATELALDVLNAARDLGVDVDTARCTARVHDALLRGRRYDLSVLGAGLGLAVDRLGIPEA
jgi:alpha-amylase/alpha-mannosidase (GH57 family)